MSTVLDRPEEITIPLSRPRALVVDDDQGLLEALEDSLSHDFDIKTARTPEAAIQILEENKEKEEDDFHLVAADINYGDLSETKGDDFIRDHRDLIGKAETVLFSGEISSEKRSELEDEGLSVLYKTRHLDEELAAIIQEKNKERTGKIEEVLENEATPRIKELTGVKIKFELGKRTSLPISQPVFDRLKETLIKWLKSRSEPDEPVFAYDKYVYSPSEMVREVENETEVGIEHVLMLLGVFEYSLKLEDGSSQPDEDDTDDEDNDSARVEENDSQFDDAR
jgi:CheY-like chemotaxis protein